MRACAILAIFVVLATAPATAEDLVYRVDTATAVISGKHMIVTAKGAVKTGGWERAHLVQKKGRGRGDIEIDFVATPPTDTATVVQALMPVRVRLVTRLPKSGVAAVRVNASTNTITAQIIAGNADRKTAGH
jgi:hypothetical protein